ncbi:hypothetical protein ACH5RR_033817 [Cinchona calisaya]|uniref:CCHC-type domain-containing protein n=1 Tax=Cinchona calisaya TaxID=153742 RepID=A0ABD2Y934_9GENT
MWQEWKERNPMELAELIFLGSNPFNFGSTINQIITREDPNLGNTEQQKNALIKLEQLNLKNWYYIKHFFLAEFVYYASFCGNTWNNEIGNKLFNKLPGALGLEINKRYREEVINKRMETDKDIGISLGQRIMFIIKILVEKCTNIQISRQLKNETSFCSQIYTPQHYDKEERPRYKNRRSIKQISRRKNYYTKRSQARKSYLNKDRHVKKYDLDRTYRKKLYCYTCNNPDHLSSVCPRRINMTNRKVMLVNNT